MNRVNRFEHGLDQYISPRANEIYSLPEIPEDYDEILKLVADHQENQVPRLHMLDRYYLGKNDGIMTRPARKAKDKADYRVPHPFAENITTFRTSYLVGKPVKTEFTGDEHEDLNLFIRDWNKQEDGDAHNLDLVTDLSKYGRAYELLHRGEDDQTHIDISNPHWSFVVYDETVRREPLFAVRYPSVTRKGEELVQVTLYLKDRTVTFAPTKIVGGKLRDPQEEPHFFGGVPVIEYSANRFRVGDYEKVIPIIDLYDHSQSDTGNYMTDTNESLLVVSGDFDPESVVYDKQANMMMLPTGLTPNGQQTSLSAKYIFPQYDVAGVEAYKDRLINNIYLFAYTPDVSDDNFSGTQSGEAMKYKLMGLEQDRAVKERLIRRGMSKRYDLVLNLARTLKEVSADSDINDLTVTFSPNLPVNLSQELPTLVSAGAKFSQSTLLAQASFVDNVQAELEAVEAERDANMNIMREQFGGDYGVLDKETDDRDEGPEDEGPNAGRGLSEDIQGRTGENRGRD